jgi:hypothetical protein
MMMMQSQERKDSNESQREMAISLINELGFDAAVAVCCEHGWENTLEQVMDMLPEETTSH